MTENIRLLAAIMFADMVGYTALMQENEAKAILNRIFKSITEDNGFWRDPRKGKRLRE